MHWATDAVLFWGVAIVFIVWHAVNLNKVRGLPRALGAFADLGPAVPVGWIVYGGCRDVAGFSLQQSLILAAIAVWLFVVSIATTEGLKEFRRWTYLDVPLIEVIGLTINLKREYFAEALSPPIRVQHCNATSRNLGNFFQSPSSATIAPLRHSAATASSPPPRLLPTFKVLSGYATEPLRI